uniref:NAD-dependent epimerase/dehydratase family protein n=1 Tax=candidate division WOR-3 bacterium TaxID=2052148 RepID=A0A7C6A9F4_UNCW3
MKGKVLVTGANGFIGSHLVEGLLARGYPVRGLVRKTSNLEYLTGLSLELCYGELTDRQSLYPAVKDIDYIFHTAGATKAKNKEDYAKINEKGTENLLSVCLEQNPNLLRLVYFSSLAAAGPADDEKPLSETNECRPVSLYGETKLKAEQLVIEYSQKFPTVILRLPTVYGPRDREALTYFKLLKKGIRPILGDYFSVIFIKDVVTAAILCLEKDIKSGEIFFVSDGNCYSFDEMAEIAERLIGVKTFRFRVPKPMLRIYAFFLTKFAKGQSIINPDKIKELTQRCWTCNINKIRDELGFSPQFGLAEGLKLTIGWYKERRWL